MNNPPKQELLAAMNPHLGIWQVADNYLHEHICQKMLRQFYSTRPLPLHVQLSSGSIETIFLVN